MDPASPGITAQLPSGRGVRAHSSPETSPTRGNAARAAPSFFPTAKPKSASSPPLGGSPGGNPVQLASVVVGGGARGDAARAQRRCGALVGGGAADEARFGGPAPARFSPRLRDAEVRDDGVARLEQDVFGL